MTRRVTLRDAADILGISKEAVRKRVTRGTLASEVGEDGRRYVYLDAGGDEGGDGGEDVGEPIKNDNMTLDHCDELIDQLRDEVEAWREEARRKDTIIMQLSQANSEMARTVRELEAPRDVSSETRESPLSDQDQVSNGDAREDYSEPQRRSWWRVLFGG